jgi:hypothetical protein
MARISIFDRLAQQLYGPTIEPTPEPVGTQGGQGPAAVAAGPTTPLYVDDRPAEEVVPPAVVQQPVVPPVVAQPPEVQKPPTTEQPPEETFVSNQVTIYWTDGSVSTAQANKRPGESESELDRKLRDGWSRTKPTTTTTTGPPAPTFPGTTQAGDPVERFNSRTFAEESYPWLKGELLETFLAVYDTNGGDAVEALENLRKTELYKTEFPGIFREDGKTLRFEGAQPELQYVKMKEDFYGQLEQYNLNPEYFKDKITQLFENDVDPDKFGRRLNVAYNTLFPQFDAVKTYYVENYPGVFPTTEDITDEAIFASFIDENVSADIISQRVEISQIGGAFKEQDFAISKEQAQRLLSAGVTGTGAQQLAARAETQLGRLQRISSRFTGREDIFGLSEFIESEVFGEGVSQRLRQRLEAEQATAFTREGGAAVTQAGVTGLVEA